MRYGTSNSRTWHRLCRFLQLLKQFVRETCIKRKWSFWVQEIRLNACKWPSRYPQSLFCIYSAFIPSTYWPEVIGNFIQIKRKLKKESKLAHSTLVVSVTATLWSWATTAKQLGWLSELIRSIRVDYGICCSDKNWDFTNVKMINSSKVRKTRQFTELRMVADVCFENTSVLACFARY